MPLCAFFNKPGENLTCLSFSTWSKSNVPINISSLAPKGKVTNSGVCPSLTGNRSDTARASVDFAQPRGPEINTPPINGLTVANNNASLNKGCPCTALKGNIACCDCSI